MGHLAKKRDIRHSEVMLLIRTIMSAASVVGGGKGDDKLNDAIKEYTDLMYPDSASDLADKAAGVARMLKKEHEGGPLKVKVQEYTGKHRKKSR